jgi:hypothetical protein
MGSAVSTREIRCEACGTINRLPDYSVRSIPECGNCHYPLPETKSTLIRRAIFRFRMQIVAASMIGTLAWVVLVAMISGSGKQIFADTPPATDRLPPPPPTCVQYLFPPQGLSEEQSGTERSATVTIRTAPGLNYLVKLDNVAIGSPALLFFLEGGHPLEARVPLGEFKLKYAAGNHWCGDSDLFGDDIFFNEAAETLTVARPTSGATRLTIELPLRSNGNFVARRITRNEFYSR